jgi:hypothetical protein
MKRVIGRVFMVPIGLLLAAAAALFVLLTLGQERLVQGTRGDGDPFDLVRALWGLLPLAKVAITPQAWIAPILLVIVGEVARIRSSLYYIVGGGATLAALPVLAQIGAGTLGLPPSTVWQVFATAGFAGGLIYWLIAGRNA